MSTDLTDGMTAATVQGEDVTFGVSADGVKVNDANVVAADVMAANGVIHVIDSVILPPSMTAAPAEAEAAPAEEAPAATTEGPTPETMPVTGGETNNLPIFMVLGLLLAVGAGIFVARRRLA
jgi:LPXTG-motif cell wall-anchored protein